MIDIPTFLMRWLFLSNLFRDIVDIQTLPYQPYTSHPELTHHPHTEAHWRDQCLRGILAQPPGSHRLYVMDAIRMELVQGLSNSLAWSDEILKRYFQCRNESPHHDSRPNRIPTNSPIDSTLSDSGGLRISPIQDESQRATVSPNAADADVRPSPREIMIASKTRTSIREYLPQLTAAVLKSPQAYDPNLADPIRKLREVILNRCLSDPSWGIELCWQLEAEVGRAWKSLFEHRQQSGRRLIIVLPADKAAVLAKIGTEKRGTFDLLQDAEQATAYGYINPENVDNEASTRMPSSLSTRRCCHFGDTMHFIDLLTQISLDLRFVQQQHRDYFLKERLYEVNRRIRRRMLTKGSITFDVEDEIPVSGWPTIEDLSVDVLKYSIHFPLVPQTGEWPSGRKAEDPGTNGVSSEVPRVLNLIVDESRLLSSRERCPYLVHLELCDSGLEARDSRLYAVGADEIGLTVEEALGIDSNSPGQESTVALPFELTGDAHSVKGVAAPADTKLRGGSQSDSHYMHYDDHLSMPDPYAHVRQHELESLHHEMFHSPEAPSSSDQNHLPTVSSGNELLSRIFGSPWETKCNEIKAASPFGHLEGWRLASFIIKAGEDIRKEALVMQVITKLKDWFQQEIDEEYRPFMRPYTMMCVGGDAGLVECLSDSKSIDEVKKQTDSFISLRDYFERAYGPPGAKTAQGKSGSTRVPTSHVSFETAQDNFLRSLVGYSLVCFILQIKDRHNANILLDREGHIMHIDFGFVLGETPKMGKVPIFSERAPFKLSSEFWEVLGGWSTARGGLGVKFCKMFEQAFATASSHADEIASMVEATMLSLDSGARNARHIANGVRSRLRMRGAIGSREQKEFIVDIVNAALTSWGTSTYDWLQRNMNGYQ